MPAAVAILKPDLRSRTNGRRPSVTDGEDSGNAPVGRRAIRSGGLHDRGGVIVGVAFPNKPFSEVGKVWELSLLLNTAADPKNPFRVNEWIKFAEREGGGPIFGQDVTSRVPCRSNASEPARCGT